MNNDIKEYNKKDKPMFYKICQVKDDGKEVLLFPKPIFCKGIMAIKLSMEKAVFEGNIVYLKVTALNKTAQELLFEDANEEELKEYNKE